MTQTAKGSGAVSPAPATAAYGARFKRDGFVVWPGFLSSAAVVRYKTICDHTLDQWRARHPLPAGHHIVNFFGATEPGYFVDRRTELVELLELIGAARTQAFLAAAGATGPLFHDTQYLMESESDTWYGEWHRDSQFIAPDPSQPIVRPAAPAEERARMTKCTLVHLRIAFTDDATLEYVPASEQRWDHDTEWEIRSSADARQRSESELPGSLPLVLKTGDAVLYHAWGLHRGHYGPAPERRSLDIMYRWGDLSAEPLSPRSHLADGTLLDQVEADARAFLASRQSPGQGSPRTT